MGTPIIEPIVGLECFNWEPPAETPNYIYSVFWDILKGWQGAARQPPNEHIFKMIQHPGSPCLWTFEDIVWDWKAHFGFDANDCWLHLEDTSGMGHFYFGDLLPISPPAEYELFTNDVQLPFNAWGYEGYGMIFWMDLLWAHVVGLGFSHAGDLRLEMFHYSVTDFVEKICSRILGTNVTFKITR